MKKYKLFIRKYNILKNDYIIEERIIETNDIYHEIGFIYCNTLEDIKRIDYFEIKENKCKQEDNWCQREKRTCKGCYFNKVIIYY